MKFGVRALYCMHAYSEFLGCAANFLVFDLCASLKFARLLPLNFNRDLAASSLLSENAEIQMHI